MNLSVILPTYNERENIQALLPALTQTLTQAKVPSFELIVIDDNSPDKTYEAVSAIQKKNTHVKLIHRTAERGLATAVKRGIQDAKGDLVLSMDTDFSHDPKYIPQLLDALQGHDMVLASRYIPGGDMVCDRFKFRLSYLLNLAIRLILGLRVHDTTGGFFVIKRKLLQEVNLDRVFTGYGEFTFQLLYALKTKKAATLEIPFIYEPRRAGNSKTNILKMGLSYLSAALKFRSTFKP